MLKGKMLSVMEELGATIFSINQSKQLLHPEDGGNSSEMFVTVYQSMWCNIP